MAKNRHKRLSVTVEPELYARLKAIQRAYRFRSLSEYVRAAVRITALRIAANMGASDGDAEREISEMFNDLSSWERQPDGTVPVRKRHKPID